MTRRVLSFPPQPQSLATDWPAVEYSNGQQAFAKAFESVFSNPDALLAGVLGGEGRSVNWLRGYLRAAQKILECRRETTE